MMRETSSVERKIRMNLTQPIALCAGLVAPGLSVGFTMEPPMTIKGNYVLECRGSRDSHVIASRKDAFVDHWKKLP
jgi:hypothetical protein